MDFPPEIWLYIHRLASPPSLLMAARSEELNYVPPQNPFHTVSLQDILSFLLVSRLWYSLAKELLYENIAATSDPRRFDALCDALEQPGTAALVRSVLLTHSHVHNFAILPLCTRVEVVCQPDATLSWGFSGSSAGAIPFPTFESLKHVYWTESVVTSEFLRGLLAAAPNLEHLFVQPSGQLEFPPAGELSLPSLPHLRRLECINLDNHAGVVQLDLTRLVRLNCGPRLPFPAVPALVTLKLFGSRKTIDFASIFERCPRLRHLSYDIWNAVVAPASQQAVLVLDEMRLHSVVTVIRDWRPIEEHFSLITSPEFPHVKRLVLEGMWYRVVGDVRFMPFKEGLRARGVQLEFPEGFVCL
ncbi:hypothetical protein FB45DRAFT_907194 [Roridomyces roridus]|uniref:F-box domain-containing protein n=1 Tax=Roridomyces roridus TaxID=1738132 RepID=A0AAD7C3F9_9AGAR|nr:hypothetical protein FB45DRAFT_907194 [Roridomyces roridus]